MPVRGWPTIKIGRVTGSAATLGFSLRHLTICSLLVSVRTMSSTAISTPISPETGAGGFILPNDRVDVILIRNLKNNANEPFASETILTNVRVLAIDKTVEEKNGQRVVVGKVATLALNSRDSEALALATRLGTLSLVLRSLVRRLAADGRMVVYSSHVLEMVEQVCSEVLILHDGRVAANNSVTELRRTLDAASLEDAFRTLVVRTDVDHVARDILSAIHGPRA